MANLDRIRAEKLMLGMGVEALILLSPESFVYATGVNAGVAAICIEDKIFPNINLSDWYRKD